VTFTVTLTNYRTSGPCTYTGQPGAERRFTATLRPENGLTGTSG
jgi:hypothetical protein